MAKYRPIKTVFWDDEYILDLKTDEKLLFLFLITNVHTTLCGIYRVSIGYIYRITGIPQKRVSEILTKFSNDSKVMFCDGWVRVVNMKKHQTASPKIAQGIQREEADIPLEIKERLYHIHSYPIATDKPVPKLKPVPVLKPIGNTTTSVAVNVEKEKKEPTRIYRICRAYYQAKLGKNLDEEDKGIVKSFVSRNARAAKLLEPYPDDKIKMAIKHVRELSARSYDKGDGQGWDWSLETVLKKIDSLTAENSKQYE